MNFFVFTYFASKLGCKLRTTPVALTASRTLTKADKGQRLVNSTATAMTLTFPANTLGADFSCDIIQAGAGAVTVAAGAGATVTGTSSFVKTAGAGSKVTLEAVSAAAAVLNGAGAV